MIDKGYDFPLYSLDLLTPDSLLQTGPRFVFPVAQGHLFARDELCQRGAGLATEVCDRAVSKALAHHDLAVAGFSEHGLTAAWAASMRHWQGRMLAQQGLRLRLSTDRQFTTWDRQGLLMRSRWLLARLALAIRMARMNGPLPAGRRPRAALRVQDTLQQAASWAADPVRAAALGAHGFSSRHQAELRQLAAELGPSREQGLAQQRAGSEAGGALVVIRAALLGDLSRLSQAAPFVLPPGHAEALQMGQLFPRRPRSSSARSGGTADRTGVPG